MESHIFVRERIAVMNAAFDKSRNVSIRMMEIVDFVDFKEDLDGKVLYRVRIRYPEVKRIRNGTTFRSWRGVENSVKRRMRSLT